MKILKIISIILIHLFSILVAEECGPEKTRKKVLKLQFKFEQALKNCHYSHASSMVSGNFSYSLINTGCSSNGQACCLETGNISAFLSGYSCGSNLVYFAPKEEFVNIFHNGTVVVSQYEVAVSTTQSIQIFNYNFHWTKSHDTTHHYVLSYLDGNNYDCPTYIDELVSCGSC